jgi:hypothetical protein
VGFQFLTAANMEYKVFWDVAPCCHVELTDVSEACTASIIRAMIAVVMGAGRTSETSVNFTVTTRRYIPEDFKLHYHI